MNNPKIKKSLDSILPKINEKEKMLSCIMQRKQKKHLLKYGLILSMACFSIIIYNKTNNSNDNEISVARNFNIYYDNTCFEEFQEYKGSKNKLIAIEENILPGGKAYKIKNSKNIVIYLDKYMEFRKCRGEIK